MPMEHFSRFRLRCFEGMEVRSLSPSEDEVGREGLACNPSTKPAASGEGEVGHRPGGGGNPFTKAAAAAAGCNLCGHVARLPTYKACMGIGGGAGVSACRRQLCFSAADQCRLRCTTYRSHRLTGSGESLTWGRSVLW